jgi:Uma2 family endonuclease
MAQAIAPGPGDWTAADLVERFGPIPLARIRQDPPPGSASEDDVVQIHAHEDRLYELVDGVLVEKTVGTYESYLALLIGRILGGHVADNDLGIALGADGMMRLAPGLVRIPDVAFISWQRLPQRRIPRQAVWNLAPDLAVEVISKFNTPEEMQRKLQDYFAAGVRQVWYVYPATREVHVFTSPDSRVELNEQQTLEGGTLLPGFSLPLERLFAEPGQERA